MAPTPFLVRASDNAGNQEHTAKVTIVVGNQAPSVSLDHAALAGFRSCQRSIQSQAHYWWLAPALP